MKITVWTAALCWAGSHELIVTTHTRKEDARKMVEHALTQEGVTYVGHRDKALSDATLAELKEAWQVHFDGPCLIKRHEIDMPLGEIDKLVADLKQLIAPTSARLEQAEIV